MYVPVQEELPNHPKVKRLARRLGISRAQALGHLVCLWLWCLRYAKDGCLDRYDLEDVEEASQWDGDRAVLWDALTHEGFVDNGMVHDWEEHQAKLLEHEERKVKDAERKRQSRAAKKSLDNPPPVLLLSDGRPTDVHRTSDVKGNESNLNQTKQEQPKHADDPAASDDEMKLRLYWAKVKRGKPPGADDREAIIQALQLGLGYDRIHGIIDPLVEYKRKQGKDIGGFRYFLPVLTQELGLATMRTNLSANNLEGAAHVLAPSSKPRIQDRDHYEVLLSQGMFNPHEWANAAEYQEEDF